MYLLKLLCLLVSNSNWETVHKIFFDFIWLAIVCDASHGDKFTLVRKGVITDSIAIHFSLSDNISEVHFFCNKVLDYGNKLLRIGGSSISCYPGN